jgi:hypothetical protein
MCPQDVEGGWWGYHLELEGVVGQQQQQQVEVEGETE